jgi:FkbM family methyltransferase
MRILFNILYKLQILRLFPQFYFHYEVRKYIKKGDIVLDIGANQGIYTKIFKDLGGFVIAVEPVDKFYFQLKADVIYRCALGGENKSCCMEQWRNTSGAYKIADKGELVWMRKGSDLFKHLSKLNFIKIDVEGSELPIIEDMRELILKHKPTILIETGRINKVLDFLPGYKIKDRCFNDWLIQ